MSSAYIILGNGFTIDFLQYFLEVDPRINEKIDVCNLFKLGDRINTPWENKPGFLSLKNCPALWTLGARPHNTKEESNALIEEIITCANMFFDFVNEPGQKIKRVELQNSNNKIYLNAYSELNVYLRHMFSCYNEIISDEQLNIFLSNTTWGWSKFFKSIEKSGYDKIIFVTYNYDIWLERILKILNIPFAITGFESNQDSNEKIEIIKPHGSISFIPKEEMAPSYSINYSLDFEGISIDRLEIQYNNLTRYAKGTIIPPAGDSMRLNLTVPWSQTLRNEAKERAKKIGKKDEVVLCGISYWHVDRRELDELLINLNPDSNFTFINPMPPRDLNAVLSSIFSKYVLQHSSSEIGGILNGETI